MCGHLHPDGKSQLLPTVSALRVPLLQEEQGDQEEVLCVLSLLLQRAKMTNHFSFFLRLVLRSFCDLNQSSQYVLCEKIFIVVVFGKLQIPPLCSVALATCRRGQWGHRSRWWYGLAQITRNTPIRRINLYMRCALIHASSAFRYAQ